MSYYCQYGLRPVLKRIRCIVQSDGVTGFLRLLIDILTIGIIAKHCDLLKSNVYTANLYHGCTLFREQEEVDKLLLEKQELWDTVDKLKKEATKLAQQNEMAET